MASPNDLIKDKNRTPFNIGKAIHLQGFRFDEIEPLLEPLQKRFDHPRQVMREILDWTGGQPFLTQKLCDLMIKQSQQEISVTVKKVVQAKIIDNWENQDIPIHLRTIKQRILADDKINLSLLKIYKSLLLGETIKGNDGEKQIKLRLYGLVVRKEGHLEILNPIYKTVFDLEWVKKQSSLLKFKTIIVTYFAIIKKLKSLWRNRWFKYSLYFVLGLISLLLIRAVYLDYQSRSISALCPIKSELLTCGEKNQVGAINFPQQVPPSKEETNGRNELAKGNYKDAINDLEEAWKTDKDPSLLIALNNAKIMRGLQTGWLNKKQVYPIAVVVPFSHTPEFISKYILTGVAWKQDQFNQKSPWKLLVLMADDLNNGKKAQQIAQEIGKTKPILGVIGHYSSGITTHVINIYNGFKINQISSTSAATRYTLKIKYSKHINKGSELNFSFFFRTVGTTKENMKLVFNHIDDKKKNVIIFYRSGDAFSLSSLDEADKFIEEKNISIVGGEPIVLEDKDDSTLKQEIKKHSQNPSLNSENTFILLLNGAYRDPKGDLKLPIIEENQGEFLIIGSNSVYDPELLNKIEQLGEDTLKNMIITTPWFPSNSSKDSQKVEDFRDFWQTEDDLYSYITMTYDATEMFIRAISKQINSGDIPTREEVNNALLSTNFEGMTGQIQLIQDDNDDENKGDRKDAPFYLIKPDCSTNNECKWKRIEK